MITNLSLVCCAALVCYTVKVSTKDLIPYNVLCGVFDRVRRL